MGRGDAAIIDAWIKQNTISCAVGKITRKMCAELRARPSVRDCGWGHYGHPPLLRPTVCDSCERFESTEGGQMEDEGGKYNCELHGPHNGMQVGSRWTAKCPVCLIEKRNMKIKETRARKVQKTPDGGTASEEKKEGMTVESVTVGTALAPTNYMPLGTIFHVPRNDEKSRIVELDFSAYPEVLDELKDAALMDFRDLNRQAIYLINVALGVREAGKDAA